ncbi:MAG: phosphatidylglycerophosphatase A [Rhodobacteraceae bacterium]|nr:phosphatidylglycerophosphatase A [Paracoccaceae bacterium]
MSLARIVATVGGIGRLRPAPGTWGSAAAVILGLAIDRFLGFPGLAVATAIAVAAGFWATRMLLHGRPGEDPGEIVIDELAGQWIALLFPSAAFWQRDIPDWAFVAWPGWVAAFLFFRLFDIWKPGPIGRADRRGDPAGVMIDDLWAGIFAGLATIVAAGIAHGILMR